MKHSYLGKYEESTYHVFVPESYNGFANIVILADIHDQFTEELFVYVKKEKIDAIIIPGDMCNEHIAYGNHRDKGKKKYNVSKKGLLFLKKCADNCPTFYSRGNHEWMFDQIDIQAIKSVGVTFLDNSFVQLPNGMIIGGVKSPLSYYKNGIIPEKNALCLNWLKRFERMEGYKILLCHHPEIFLKYLQKYETNLVVSGHAHGGQVRIGKRGLYAPGQGFFPQYIDGIHDNKLVISRGLANTLKIIPRFNNRLEIVRLLMSKC